jgi:hypothetical protein
MATNFLHLAVTDSVRRAQEHYYGDSHPAAGDATAPDALTPAEVDFIQARDSFYMATVNADGWPYIQHRGGRPGFLRVLDSQQLAFVDYRGNRHLELSAVVRSERSQLFSLSTTGTAPENLFPGIIGAYGRL